MEEANKTTDNYVPEWTVDVKPDMSTDESVYMSNGEERQIYPDNIDDTGWLPVLVQGAGFLFFVLAWYNAGAGGAVGGIIAIVLCWILSEFIAGKIRDYYGKAYWYPLARHIFIIAFRKDEGKRLPRFSDDPEVIYCEASEAGNIAEEIEERLLEFENDKDVRVFAFIQGYGRNKGETDSEFLDRAEGRVLDIMQEREAVLAGQKVNTVQGADNESKQERRDWYQEHIIGTSKHLNIEPHPNQKTT